MIKGNMTSRTLAKRSLCTIQWQSPNELCEYWQNTGRFIALGADVSLVTCHVGNNNETSYPDLK